MSTKNNKPLVLAPKKKKAKDVTSNIHEALQQTNIINIPENLNEAAPGFGVLNDVLASPEKHDKDVVVAASLGSTFNPIAALQSMGGAIKDAPGTAFLGLGKILTDALHSYDKEELQGIVPENVSFLINDLFADGASMPTYTEADAPDSLKDALARAYFESQARQRGEGSSAKWRDNEHTGLVYGDYLAGLPKGIEAKFSNPDWLASKHLGSAQVIENEDGTITINDTFDFNDSEWSEAGLTRLHYDKDGNVDLGKYDSETDTHIYKEGSARKQNPYGGKPVSEMSSTEKLMSALEEIKTLGGVNNVQTHMRTLAFYFGSKDDSGRPISITMDPHAVISRAPITNWDERPGAMYYGAEEADPAHPEHQAYKDHVTNTETRGRVWGSASVNSVRADQRKQNFSLINKANKALGMFTGSTK